jgi:cytoskeletal protein RodZ
LRWIDSIPLRGDGNFTETLGQYLRREREARSVSLEEISRGTRISRPYLEALERDDYHFFSKREFTLGFLRGYARHLGLDPDEVLKRYRMQAELAGRKETFEQIPLFSTSDRIAEEISDSEKVPPTPPAKNRRPSRRGILIQLVILLAAVGLTLYFHHLLKQAGNREKSPGPGGRSSREKEAILNRKVSGQNPAILQGAQEDPGEHPKETRSSKKDSASKEGNPREDTEALKGPHRKAFP